jgi:hypothetical protein
VTETSSASQLEALQSALAAELAAIFGYGVVGGRLGGSGLALAQAGYDAHRRRRTTLEALIAGTGATPTPPAPAYQVPAHLDSDRQIERFAATLEHRCAEVYAVVVSAADLPALRKEAAGWLRDAAVRAVVWGGRPEAWPGLATADVSSA